MAVRPSLLNELPNQGHYFNEAQPRKRLTVPAIRDHKQGGVTKELREESAIALQQIGFESGGKTHQQFGQNEPLLRMFTRDYEAYLQGKGMGRP